MPPSPSFSLEPKGGVSPTGELPSELGGLPTARLQWLLDKVSLRPNDSVLDLGCGLGRIAHLTQGKVRSYVGVDRAPRNVTIASDLARRNRLQSVHFEQADILDFCRSQTGRFDKIFLIDVDVVLSPSILEPLLRRTHELLNPGGELDMYTSNGAYFVERLRGRAFFPRALPEVHLRTADDFRSLLSEAGYRRMDMVPLGHYRWPLSLFNPFVSVSSVGPYFTARYFVRAGVGKTAP